MGAGGASGRAPTYTKSPLPPFVIGSSLSRIFRSATASGIWKKKHVGKEQTSMINAFVIPFFLDLYEGG